MLLKFHNCLNWSQLSLGHLLQQRPNSKHPALTETIMSLVLSSNISLFTLDNTMNTGQSLMPLIHLRIVELAQLNLKQPSLPCKNMEFILLTHKWLSKKSMRTMENLFFSINFVAGQLKRISIAAKIDRILKKINILYFWLSNW